jgi:hypothetical protein
MQFAKRLLGFAAAFVLLTAIQSQAAPRTVILELMTNTW